MALFCGTAWCLEQMVSVCVPDSGAIYMRGNFHVTWARAGQRKLCLHLFLNNCIVPFGFLPWGIQVAFPGESQLQQSSTTQPMLHAGCFSITIIHQTLTRITGSLTCICDLFACITYGDLGLWSHPKKIFFFFFWGGDVRVCTEFDLGETCMQSLAWDSHPSMWWPCSVVLNHDFQEWVFSLCATIFSILAIPE